MNQQGKSNPGSPAASKNLPSAVNKMTYKKLRHRITMLGPFFEVKMNALLYLRGINSGKQFQLATNVVGAGKLDDIMFKFKTSESSQVWNTCFIQLKHKARVQSLEIEDFELVQYLKSFVDIKKAMTQQTKPLVFDGSFAYSSFIIFTNASICQDQINPKRVVQSNIVDEFVRTGVESENIINFVCPRSKDKHNYTAFGNTGAEFLQRLRLFTGEPREDQLDDIIKVELKKYCQSQGVKYFDGIYSEYKNAFHSWWEDNEGVILDQTSPILQHAMQQAKVEILDQEQKKSFRFHIRFLDNTTSGMKGAFPDQHSHVNIVADVSVRLASTKLLQALETEKQSYIFVGTECLLRERDAVTSAWRNGRKHLLVIASDTTGDKQKLCNVCTELCKVLAENPVKKIVLLSLSGDKMAKRLQEMLGQKFTVRTDNFQMSQLNQKSISWILAKQVIFQGQSTDLGSILSINVDTWSLKLNGCFDDVIACNNITIGAELEEVISYYVPRTMLSKKVVKNTIFSDKSFAGKIVLQGATLEDISELTSDVDQNKRNKFHDVSGCIEFNAYDGSDSENTCNDIHYLEVIDEKLIWKKSEGKLSFIKRHIDGTVTYTIPDIDNKFFLLVAEPGMGKSTFMTHLARQYKQKHPNTWVVCLVLNDHASLFAKTKEEGFNAEEFITSALGIGKLSALEQALFKYSLDTGNIAVLLDAFDEIAPTYVSKCCALVTSLLTTKVKHVWLTSRPSMQDTLETLTSNLAVTLRKFSQEDQEIFLRKYWKKSSKLTVQELNVFITKILRNTSQSMNDIQRDFTGIPLQTHMLAEIFQDNINDSLSAIYQPMDVLELIEQFVDKKIKLYVQKEYNVCKDSNNFEEKLEIHIDSSKEKHKMAALFLFFNDDDINQLLSKANIKQLQIFFDKVQNARDKSGIIYRIVDQKPIFVHRVFAEYFSALFFAEIYSKNTDFIRKNLLTDTSVVIRNILNLLLSRDNKLHRAVLHADIQQVKTLLLMEETDVKAQDEGGRTALHYAVATGLNRQSESKTNIEIMELLLKHGARADIPDDVLQWTPVVLVDTMELWAEMDKLISHGMIDITDLTNTKLNIDNQKMWQSVIKHDFVHLMAMLIDLGLPVDSLFDDRKSSTLLHIAAMYGSKDIAALLLKQSETITFENNVHDGNMDASMSTVSMLLFIQNRLGRTPLMNACAQGHQAVVELLLACFTDDAARVEYIKRRDNDALSAMWWSASRGQHEIVQLLLDHGADVKASDSDGTNVLMEACLQGHKIVVEMLLASFTDDAARVEYVNSRDNDNNSARRISALWGRHDIVQLLLDAGAKRRE